MGDMAVSRDSMASVVPYCSNTSWNWKQKLEAIHHILASSAETKRGQGRVDLHRPTDGGHEQMLPKPRQAQQAQKAQGLHAGAYTRPLFGST